MLEKCSSFPALALNNMCAVTREFLLGKQILPQIRVTMHHMYTCRPTAKKACTGKVGQTTAVDHPTIRVMHTGGGEAAVTSSRFMVRQMSATAAMAASSLRVARS